MRRFLGPALALASAMVPSAPGVARRAVLHDTNIIVDPTLVPGTEASVFVQVRGATDLTESEPVAGAGVRLRLASDVSRAARELAFARTDHTGAAVLSFRVPEELPSGERRLILETRSEHGHDTVEKTIEVRREAHLHLRTDRVVYQPGQRLRWRVVALNPVHARPLRGAELELVIRDPRGTALWRGTKKTDRFGMIAGDLPLGDDLILGEYELAAVGLGQEASRGVKIKRFKLPPFQVDIETDAKETVRPGARLRGVITARYHYGEPVSGKIDLRAGDSQRRVELDARGRHRFSFEAPERGGPLQIAATVTDGAGRAHRAERDLIVSSGAIQLAVIPERQVLSPGARQRVTILTTDGRGDLVPAKVSLSYAGNEISRRSPGAVRIPIRVPEGTRRLELSATASTRGGAGAAHQASVAVAAAPQRSVRVRQAVVESGEAIEVRGRWPGADGPVVLTLIRDGVPLARARAGVRGGRLEAKVTPPAGVFGLAVLRATDLHWDRQSGRALPRTAAASVYLRPARAHIEISGEGRHRPGDRARLTAKVTDASGRPVPGAGLAASVVDERALALGRPKPDLVTAIRELHGGDAEAAGLAFADLLAGDANPARRRAMRAVLESLPLSPEPPWTRIEAAERYRAEWQRIDQAGRALWPVMVEHEAALGARRADGSWRYEPSLDSLLARAGWKQARRQTPWQEPTAWGYAVKLVPHLAFEQIAPRVARERLTRLSRRLLAHPARVKRRLARRPDSVLRRAPRHLRADPWGTEIRIEVTGEGEESIDANLVSAGPDLAFETSDDLRIEGIFALGMTGVGYGGGGGSAFGSIGTGRYGTIGHGSGVGSAREQARLRQNFDQTVLWVAGIETDATGRALLEVPLADSITGWEVEVEAVGPGGLVGAATSRLETFLPVHADVEVPRALTVGDRYHLRVAVTNHTARAGRFALEAKVSGAAELLGDSARELTVQEGDAHALSLPIRALRPGEATVRVALSGGGKSLDRIERKIRVKAPGRLVRRIQPRELEGGDGALSLEVPEERAEGTFRGRLTFFRGAADLAIDGLEGLLREPHGCFEQTSSATYPNLLALELLGDKEGTEEVRARARDLVAKGYQRLISYEVQGGGFSWFGKAPANQILTAYGVLEFSDMARVYPVDPDLIKRTRRWLVKKQRSDGSWKRDERWLHDWSAVQGDLSTTAYIAWALAESGRGGPAVKKALRFLRRHQSELAGDPYLLSLWAAAESAAGNERSGALSLLQKRAGKQDGSFHAGGRTLFGATGRGADVQVTALAAQALSRAGKGRRARKSVDWLLSARDPRFGWGSTQPTVLSLRAAAIAASRSGAHEGEIKVSVGDQELGTVDLAAPELPVLGLPSLSPGSHQVVVAGPKGADLRAELRFGYRERGRPESQAHGLEVSWSAPQKRASVGEKLELGVKLKNPGADAVAMPTVVVPVPPGFRAERSSLEGLRRSGAISRFEDHGGELYLYLEELAAGAELDLNYWLVAETRCRVTQRPARAYAYYNPDVRGSSAALTLEAVSRERALDQSP